MPFCTKCGTEFSDNDFCGKCGEPRAASGGTPSASSPTTLASKRRSRWLLLVIFGSLGLAVVVAMLSPDQTAQQKGSSDAGAAIAKPSDHEILSAYCTAIPLEDDDNGGVRADGKPWDLTDLAVDGPNHYNIFVLGQKSDLPHLGKSLYDALRREPAGETIRQMCARIGQPVSSSNASVDLTTVDAAEALERSIRLSAEP